MKKCCLAIICLITAICSRANNVNITNVSIVNGGVGNVKVKFDLSWDNSWRVNTGQNNYDGAWVFFRYRRKGSTVWETVYFNGLNNSTSPDYSIYQSKASNNGSYIGAVIYRSTNGFGPVNFTNIQLTVTSVPYNIDIKAFAVEMVYVPAVNIQYLGDGNGTTESTNAFHNNGHDNKYALTGLYFSGIPFLQDIQTDPNSFDDDYLNWENGKQLYLADTGFSYTSNPADRTRDWPTGASFWSMKYELSQGAYRDFLNCLTATQQAARTAALTTAARGTLAMVTAGTPVKTFIKIDTASTATAPAVYGCDANGDGIYNGPNDGEWTSCGYLSYPDLAAYLSWSGLAPMTEVFYERMCRGSSDGGLNEPIYGDYAWGTNQVTANRYTLSNANAAGETVSNMAASDAAGYANYNATSPNNIYSSGAPLRNGIFASFSGADRISSGASYYGIMELSGNLQEVCVTLGNATGRLFKGINGNGGITTAGNAPAFLFWPGNTTSTTQDATNYCYNCDVIYGAGTIMRGGDYSNVDVLLRVSDRSQDAGSEQRLPYRGGRGVLYCK
jgi:formylglycine-generating enzyme required for sulfatase activity